MGWPKGNKRGMARDNDTAPPKKKVAMFSSRDAEKSVSQGPSKGNDADGNPYWELSHKRRVTVSEWKNMTFVGLREFYEKDGEMKPGKSGISLTVEQYQAFLNAIGDINAELRDKGIYIEEPVLTPNASASKSEQAAADDEEDDAPQEDEKPKVKTSKKAAKSKPKPKSKGKAKAASEDEDEDEDGGEDEETNDDDDDEEDD